MPATRAAGPAAKAPTSSRLPAQAPAFRSPARVPARAGPSRCERVGGGEKLADSCEIEVPAGQDDADALAVADRDPPPQKGGEPGRSCRFDDLLQPLERESHAHED